MAKNKNKKKKTRFVNKWYFIMWVVALILSLAFTYQFSQMCAYNLYDTVCYTKWSFIILDIVISSIVYNMIYYLVYSIIKGNKSRHGK
jgi:hypothetical protein